MISSLFNTFIYNPIYNALAVLVHIVPGGDVGIAIIILTLIIKFALFPLSLKALRTQAAMRDIDPLLKDLRKKYENNKEELAKKTLALLTEKKVNPFASIFLILIQLPIIFGLYFVFLLEGGGSGFDPALLYSFVPQPAEASLSFLGLINITGKSIILAALVAVTQYINAQLMQFPEPQGKEGSLSHDLSKSMQVQMKYVFPVMMGVVAYVVSSAIALYFLVSNLFQLFQELYVRKTIPKPQGQ
ncbi:MAG: YidC/Oxa1 family membrane protein insertase [Patescibacteria group bacterium]